MKVEIDQETCVGAGQCALAAPDVFDQRDDDGVVTLLDEVPPEAQSAASRGGAAPSGRGHHHPRALRWPPGRC